ncbi:FAD/NAD(P)-binding protein [Pseudorhodoferax soli]|uniref:Putative NAD(P)/FAD-binding protein YdhS n=1 Tax=Pseudorhodoferax soli TaxID=545864 RepID=A0A368XB28_9BURK|nr:FAD/NAD(P)-binding protein [Pseudorhodoferax soli]RCW63224.1 putative NAD(P)/FAD-binding protein YdhS [Pseudorhodoferax soli]
METARRVAVVGGGSVATSYLFHFVEAWEARPGAPSAEVVVYEPRESVGRGGAYDVDLDSNLLNVTAGSMSVAGDDRQHFFRWLKQNGITEFRGEPITMDGFLPRPLFGQYLEEAYRDVLQRAERCGVAIEHRRAAALELERLASGFGVRASDGSRESYDRVVLAIGNLDSIAFPQLKGDPRYFDTPYPVRSLCNAIPSDATVGILGTSLSAIDAIAALAANGHRGLIVCVSRNGRLPCVRGTMNAPTPLRVGFKQWLTAMVETGQRVPLKVLIDRIQEELATYSIQAADLLQLAEVNPDPLRFLEDELRESSSAPRNWQSFGNALNDVVDQLWHLLSPEDRQTFDRTIRPIWMARRVTFPIANARTLARMMQNGQLRVRGGFHDVEKAASTFTVRCEGVRPETFSCDAIVNATSFSCDAARSSVPLLQALLREGSAVADPHGGLQLDFASGGVVTADGTIQRDLTALGSMAAGTYFWTNSMDVNARLAMVQARQHVHAMRHDLSTV